MNILLCATESWRKHHSNSSYFATLKEKKNNFIEQLLNYKPSDFPNYNFYREIKTSQIAHADSSSLEINQSLTIQQKFQTKIDTIPGEDHWGQVTCLWRSQGIHTLVDCDSISKCHEQPKQGRNKPRLNCSINQMQVRCVDAVLLLRASTQLTGQLPKKSCLHLLQFFHKLPVTWWSERKANTLCDLQILTIYRSLGRKQ